MSTAVAPRRCTLSVPVMFLHGRVPVAEITVVGPPPCKHVIPPYFSDTVLIPLLTHSLKTRTVLITSPLSPKQLLQVSSIVRPELFSARSVQLILCHLPPSFCTALTNTGPGRLPLVALPQQKDSAPPLMEAPKPVTPSHLRASLRLRAGKQRGAESEEIKNAYEMERCH